MDAAAQALRFTWFIEVLCRALAERAAKRGFAWIYRGGVRNVPTGPLAAQLAIRLWNRLRRAATRFTVLAAALQNQVPQAHPRPTRIRKPRATPPQAKPDLPRHFAWLQGSVPEAVSSAGQLRILLADPGMQEIIAADPRFGRILRPLCHMLGLRPPPFLRLARPAPIPAPILDPQAETPSTHAHPAPAYPAPTALAQVSRPNEQRAPPPLSFA